MGLCHAMVTVSRDPLGLHSADSFPPPLFSFFRRPSQLNANMFVVFLNEHCVVAQKQIWTPPVGCPDESTLNLLAKQILNGEVMRTTSAIEHKMVVLQDEGTPGIAPSPWDEPDSRECSPTPRAHAAICMFPVQLNLGLIAMSYLYDANPSASDSCSYGSTTLGTTTGTLTMSTKFVLSFVVPLVYMQNFSSFFGVMADHAPVLIDILRGFRAGFVSASASTDLAFSAPR